MNTDDWQMWPAQTLSVPRGWTEVEADEDEELGCE